MYLIFTISFVNEKSYVEKISTEESKACISKRVKYNLQPYIGSNLCRKLSSKNG
jgi:hypothetical protein